MAKYTGRKSTVQKYKAARANFMKRVKRLEAKGVLVNKDLIPGVGGHVTMKDVHRLEKLTSEKIAMRSEIAVTEEKYITGHNRATVKQVKTVIATGRDVVRELKKRGVRSAREKRKARESGKIYVDPDTGYKINVETGEMEKASKREIERARKQQNQEASEQGVPPVDIPIDYFDDGFDDSDYSDIDFDSEFIKIYTDQLGMFTMDNDTLIHTKNPWVKKTGRNANTISNYINDAISKYGSSAVADALRSMGYEGITITPMMLYKDEEFDFYMAKLESYLPLNDRFDYDAQSNDEDEYEEEYYD